MSRIVPSGEVRQRQPRELDKRHLGFIAKLPCLSCMCRGRGERWPVEVCHIRTGFHGFEGWREVGKSERPHDWRTFPGCPWCHRLDKDSQHAMSEQVWWRGIGVFPPALCAALRACDYDAHSGRMVIRRASRHEFPWPD